MVEEPEEKTITLLNDKGEPAIVVDTDENVVFWAGRGYFSAEARAKIEESSAPKAAKDTETEASIPIQKVPKGRRSTAER